MKKKATEKQATEKKTESEQQTVTKAEDKSAEVKKTSSVERKCIYFLIFMAAAAVIYGVLTATFTVCRKHVSILTALIILAVCFGGYVMSEKVKKDRLKRFLKGTAAACLIAFGTETLIFNFKSFAKGNTETVIEDYSSITANDPNNARISVDKIEIAGDSTLYVELNSKDINALELEFDGKGKSTFRCCAGIMDGNFSQEYVGIGEKKTSADYGKCNFAFSTYEELKSVRLEFYDISEPVTITRLSFAKALPFAFSEIRFYALFLLLTAIAAVRAFELHKVVYDRKNARHRIVIIALTALCSLTMLCFVDPDASDIEYEKGMDVSWQNPYVQMFDACENGRTSIGITPSESLLAMENPYDTSLRSAQGVECAWDRAFYKGKYYSYYGIAPVLTYYYPYYFMRGKLPSINSACVFFGMLSVVFMFGAIMAFIRKFIEKPNFLLVIMCLTASVFASGVYFNVDFSDMYALPGITGTCYLMLCLWCGFEACIRDGEKKQPILFVLCGLAFSLCLASKPTRALSALILAPIFLELIFSKKIKIKSKIVSAASFLLPVAVGCGALMAYNNARFESPFEFGAVYQLTVSNVNAGSLKISFLPNAILHYFIQPVRMSGSFPFVEIGGMYIANRQAYIYSDFAVGALTVPLIAAGMAVFPFLMYHLRRRKGEKLSFNGVSVRKATYIMMLLFSIFIALFNYCVAGIILSYVCDILPLLTLLSVIVLLDVQQQTAECRGISGKVVCAFSVTAVFTVVLVCLELLSFQNIALFKHFPNILYNLEELLCFWN